MQVVNLLEFLNTKKNLYTLDYLTCESELLNFLDIISEDQQFTQKIDLGVIFIQSKTLDQCTIVDGLGRILSLSLLLHAVCECYKKTSEKNDKAIKTIRAKYLINGDNTKLRLPEVMQNIYSKIIFGEKLSGKEKKSPVFVLLHNFWSQIKSEHIQASDIFNMLSKVSVMIVESADVSKRDLYYQLNKERRDLDQLILIDNYLETLNIKKEWDLIKKIFKNNKNDISLFFKDFFITKFNFKEFDIKRLYEFFVNYFETMMQYQTPDILIGKISKTAKLYSDIINVQIENEQIKSALIKIKMHKGEDTYAYLLNIYEDYVDGNITEVTLLEILSTIDEYLKNRLKTPNNVTFNELIQYLNTFITCK